MKANVTMNSSRAVAPRTGRARRGAQAGLVYIETLMVCGVLTILLAGTAFTFELFSAKLDSLQQARQTAWERAMPGCRWQSAYEMPRRSAEGLAFAQSGFETSWAARLETQTILPCNELSRDDDSLSDSIYTVTTEVAKTGRRTVPVIDIAGLLTAIQSAAQLGQQTIQALSRSLEASPVAEAVRALIRDAIAQATQLML